MNWDDLRVVAAVRDQGSYAGASPGPANRTMPDSFAAWAEITSVISAPWLSACGNSVIIVAITAKQVDGVA
jgi:hypothetical protein